MPKGVYERKVSEVEPLNGQEPQITEEVKPKERKHNQEGHPLCLACEHRDEMHHVWKHYQVTKIVKDFLGNSHAIVEDAKDKVYDVQIRPCQHACKCGEYK